MDSTRERDRGHLLWGWLRLLLGFLQMSLAAAGLGAMLAIGLHPLTYALVGAATVAAIASRLMYRGKSGPLPPERSDRQ